MRKPKRKAPPRRPSREQCEALETAPRKAGAVGHEHALRKGDVLALPAVSLGTSQPSRERCLRAIVQVAPEYDVPIVSCNDGCYVAIEAEDFDLCIADLSSRRGELSKRIDALLRMKYEPPPAAADGRLF